MGRALRKVELVNLPARRGNVSVTSYAEEAHSQYRLGAIENVMNGEEAVLIQTPLGHISMTYKDGQYMISLFGSKVFSGLFVNSETGDVTRSFSEKLEPGSKGGTVEPSIHSIDRILDSIRQTRVYKKAFEAVRVRLFS